MGFDQFVPVRVKTLFKPAHTLSLSLTLSLVQNTHANTHVNVSAALILAHVCTPGWKKRLKMDGLKAGVHSPPPQNISTSGHTERSETLEPLKSKAPQ